MFVPVGDSDAVDVSEHRRNALLQALGPRKPSCEVDRLLHSLIIAAHTSSKVGVGVPSLSRVRQPWSWQRSASEQCSYGCPPGTN